MSKRNLCSLLAGADEEDGDVCAVTDFVNGAAENEVTNKTMAMHRHGD